MSAVLLLVLPGRDAGMSNVPTSTGLPITWQCCKRHDWKHEKVVCPFCRAEKAERELEEARKALALREEVNPNVDGLVGPCQICGTAPLTLDYLVDDAYWDANIPGSLRAKLICLACLVRQAGSTALHHVRVIYLTFGGLTQAFVPIGRQNSNPAARAAGGGDDD